MQTPNGTVDVVFDINEGEKTGIKEIRFVGNHAYFDVKLLGPDGNDGDELSVVLQDLRRLRSRPLAKDAEAIRRYYLKNGYADFHVIGVDRGL